MTKFNLDNSHSQGRPPVIILGAARSGTKLLRGLVAATGCYAEVPFDVNYIWRYGNESCPHDALPADQVAEAARQFIRNRLRRCATRQAGAPDGHPLAFVEKTVSNVLRVPFVKTIYPEAKFVVVVRDGRDVVESAERCWREPPRAGYMLTKLRTFPWLRCAPYGWKYAVDVVRRILRIDEHLRTWGPRYPGIDADLARLSLLEVCARQWVASIEHYERGKYLLTPEQVLELRYEELVGSTQKQIHRLCDFLHVEARRSALEAAQRTIRTDRMGSSRRLPRKDSQQVLEIVRPTLERWGYSIQSLAGAA